MPKIIENIRESLVENAEKVLLEEADFGGERDCIRYGISLLQFKRGHPCRCIPEEMDREKRKDL